VIIPSRIAPPQERCRGLLDKIVVTRLERRLKSLSKWAKTSAIWETLYNERKLNMKMLPVNLIACALGATLWIMPIKADADADDVAKIRALEDQFVAAFNAKDVDAIMKVYVPDETLVVFDVVPPRQYVGANAYRKDWEAFFATLKGPLQFKIGDLSIETDGNLGYSHSIQYVSGTDMKGQPLNLTVRVTDAYRKINGKWLIIHEHVSVPVDMETGKPDFSSKP
jgi:uncharacterized protein (TIGR02246 family)